MKKFLKIILTPIIFAIPVVLFAQVLRIETVPQGGTGWGNIQSGTFLTGNGTGRLSTSTCAQITGSASLCDGNDATGEGGGGSGTVGTSTQDVSSQVTYWSTTNGFPALLASVATGTVSGSGGITATAQRYVLNGALTVGCTAADTSNTGCLSSTDWNTFNGKESVLTFTTPLDRTSNTIAFNSNYIWTPSKGSSTIVTGNFGNVNATGTMYAGSLTLGTKLPNAQLANSSIVLNTTAPITGGATAALGDTLTFACASCFTGTVDWQQITLNGVQVLTPTTTQRHLRVSSTTVEGTFNTGSLNATSSAYLGSLTLGTKLANAQLANSSIVINTASPLGGGATAALGDTISLTCTGCATFAYPFPTQTLYGGTIPGTTTALWFASTTIQNLTVNNFNATSSTASSSISGPLALRNNNLSINGVHYKWPVADGAATAVLSTDGAGTLSYISCATLTGSADLCDGTDATGGGGGVADWQQITLNGGQVLTPTTTTLWVRQSSTTVEGTFNTGSLNATSSTYLGSLTLGTKLANAQLANSSLTYTAGNGLTGGGAVSLGSSATIDLVVDSTFSVSADSVGLNLNNGNAWTASTTFHTGNFGVLNATSSTYLGSLTLGTKLANAQLANSSLSVTGTNGITVSGCGPVSLGGTCALTGSGVLDWQQITIGGVQLLTPTTTQRHFRVASTTIEGSLNIGTLTATSGTSYINALNLSTDLSVANGGTGASTLTGLLQGNGASAFTVVTDSSTVGQALRVTGSSAYGWGALNLSNTDAITGTLPIANGGTNNTVFSPNSLVYFNATRISATNSQPLYIGNLVGTTTSASSIGGNFGIGTTTPYASLSINAPAQNIPYIAIGSTTQEVLNLSVSTFPVVGIGTSTPNALLAIHAPFVNAGSVPPLNLFLVASSTSATVNSTFFSITASGKIFAPNIANSTSGNAICYLAGTEIITSGGATCALSSAKTKHDIISLLSGDDILKLRPVQFVNNEGGDIRYGLIAEEVELIDPIMVEHAQRDTVLFDGQIIKKGAPISVDYFRSVLGKLIKFVQDLAFRLSGIENKLEKQQAEIELLRARLDSLEKR